MQFKKQRKINSMSLGGIHRLYNYKTKQENIIIKVNMAVTSGGGKRICSGEKH